MTWFWNTTGVSWSQQAKLTAADAAAGDQFGFSVSVSGDTAVIGAFGDDDAGPSSGSAYVFGRGGGSWSQQAKLTAADAAAGDQFGVSVSVSGDTAVIGALLDGDAGFASGSAYVFVRGGGSWSQQAKLTAAASAAVDTFGSSVSVSGDPAVIGAFGDDDAGPSSGSAYVFGPGGDTTPPVVTPPGSITVEATEPGGAPVTNAAIAAFLAGASAVDDVDGPIAPSNDAPGTFPLGTTTVTFSATDAATNTGTAQATVTVEDTTAPVVSPPADQVAEATSPAGAVVSYPPATATDDVGVAVGPDCLPASGSTFPLGDTTVVCTAEDAAGNVGSASFAVTVQDTTPPVVTPSADQVAEATGPAGAVVSYPPATATDDVGVAVGPDCLPASGSTFPLGDTTVVCTAEDVAGNVGSASFTVTVEDTTAPELVIAASPDELWPPNHKYVEVVVTIDVFDIADPNVSFVLVSAVSNEPDNGAGDGNTTNDIVMVDETTFLLRAERSGSGNGRIYTITYEATAPQAT